jgi:hypothetical protein
MKGNTHAGSFPSASWFGVHLDGKSDRAARSARHGVRLYGTLFRAGAVCLTPFPLKS